MSQNVSSPPVKVESKSKECQTSFKEELDTIECQTSANSIQVQVNTPGEERKEFEGFKFEVIINTPDIVIHCCPKT